MPLELADVIEGRPHIRPDLDLSAPVAQTDVLVIGGVGRGRPQPCSRRRTARR